MKGAYPRGGAQRTEPKPGTKTRELFDLLQLGKPISIADIRALGIAGSPANAISQLSVTYDMPIRRVGAGVYQMEVRA